MSKSYEVKESARVTLRSAVLNCKPFVEVLTRVKSNIDEWDKLTAQYTYPERQIFVALLLKELKVDKDALLPLWNKPSPAYYIFRTDEQLAEALQVIGLPDSLTGCYKVSKPNAFAYGDMTQLMELENVAHVFKVSKTWADKVDILLEGARKVIVPKLNEAELELIKALTFDHYYAYSDDNKVWMSGHKKHEEAKKYAEEMRTLYPELHKVVELYSMSIVGNPNFFDL